MDSTKLSGRELIAWRKYLVKKNDRMIDAFFGLAFPCEKKSSELLKEAASCRVYLFPEDLGGREIEGRDEMEAICHALLAVEARLLFLAKEGVLFNEDGSKADIEDFGLFFGVIGRPYLKRFGKKIDQSEF